MSSVKFDYGHAFFSNLSEFRISGKYSDVVIECGMKSFRCHRLVLAAGSEYFNSMFGSGFEESVAGNIVLRDIDATTFDLVLQFLYSGKLLIDPDNILDMLQISDFFGIKGLEELCFLFLADNLRTVNVLELFLFACMTEKTLLIDKLKRCDMTEQLGEYFKSDAHLGLPFDVFARILKLWKPTSQDAIVRWTNSSIESRRQHFDELVRTHAEATIPDFGASLYVHTVCYPGRGFAGRVVKTYAINNSCSTTCPSLPDLDVRLDVIDTQVVVVDDSLLFVLQRLVDEDGFFMSQSVDMRPTCSLKPPPVVEASLILCNMPNHGIYMYDRCLTGEPCGSGANLTHDETFRGILLYNHGVDDYFSVPPPKRIAEEACMTVLDNMLYLIGGIETPNYVQAYDHRAGMWLKMPETKFDHAENLSCASMNGTIYVYGGGKNFREVQKFDGVAGKWERIMHPPTERLSSAPPWVIRNNDVKTLVPYADRLWMFEPSYYDDLHIDVYDPVRNAWRVVTLGSEYTNHCAGAIHDVMTGFVFRSL